MKIYFGVIKFLLLLSFMKIEQPGQTTDNEVFYCFYLIKIRPRLEAVLKKLKLHLCPEIKIFFVEPTFFLENQSFLKAIQIALIGWIKSLTSKKATSIMDMYTDYKC